VNAMRCCLEEKIAIEVRSELCLGSQGNVTVQADEREEESEER
jgi:hypothetical protein